LEEDGPFGDGYNLLRGLGQYGGTDAKPVFHKYLEHSTVQRCRTMCHVLRKVRGEWAINLLAPLLNDRREANGWTYPVKANENEPRLPIRICDEAAQTIALGVKNEKISFSMVGTHADLDRQIGAIQQWITKNAQ
jgi:hypothetical protein